MDASPGVGVGQQHRAQRARGHRRAATTDHTAFGKIGGDPAQTVPGGDPLERLDDDRRLVGVGLLAERRAARSGRRCAGTRRAPGRAACRRRRWRRRPAGSQRHLGRLVLGVDGVLQQRAAVPRVARVVDPRAVRGDGDRTPRRSHNSISSTHSPTWRDPRLDSHSTRREAPKRSASEVGEQAVEVVAALPGGVPLAEPVSRYGRAEDPAMLGGGRGRSRRAARRSSVRARRRRADPQVLAGRRGGRDEGMPREYY